jgi:hypothetical protein
LRGQASVSRQVQSRLACTGAHLTVTAILLAHNPQHSLHHRYPQRWPSNAMLGLAEQYQRVYDDGMKCHLTLGRQETTYQLSSDFARYLDAHPEDANGPFPLAFLLLMADCPKN